MTIHTPGDGHISPSADALGHTWLRYTDVKQITMLQLALGIMQKNVRGNTQCNACFSSLPGGRTFDSVLDDPSVFISLNIGPDRAVTKIFDHDIAISVGEYDRGRWAVAATLCHEMAHINGAPTTTTQAEDTLGCCGFGADRTPGLVGSVDYSQDDNSQVASTDTQDDGSQDVNA